MREPPIAGYSLRILWSLARWVEDQKGTKALEEIAEAAGVRASDFDGSTRWVTLEQFETFLSRVAQLAGSEADFMQVCTYRFEESYGALRYMLWAISPKQLYDSAAKLSELVTTVGKFEVIRSERSTFHIRYRSSEPESRLMCLSRQAQWTVGPSIWGLPSARLEEHGCIAHGDPYCEYRLRWFDGWRILPAILGLGVGACGAFALQHMNVGVSAWVSLPIMGAVLGHAFELRRMHSNNMKLGKEMTSALRELANAEFETRSELAAIHARQREWMQLVEEQAEERTRKLERIVDGLQGLQKSRVSTLRGFSHDLRNPLFVVRGNAQFLRGRVPDGEEAEALRDMEAAAGQIETMVTQLMSVATGELDLVKFAPKMIDVAPLADTFRRRLRALVYGRDIRVSVFSTREAPAQIEIDTTILDRIVDNLLTNAAKYTQRGSIVLEVGGTVGAMGQGNGRFLTLKLSDTGRGIADEDVAKIFLPRSQNERSLPNSYGLGLSSVVRLLAQIGGRIEVMSKPGAGTTFWAHLPERSAASSSSSVDELEGVESRVVHIRRIVAS